MSRPRKCACGKRLDEAAQCTARPSCNAFRRPHQNQISARARSAELERRADSATAYLSLDHARMGHAQAARVDPAFAEIVARSRRIRPFIGGG